MSFKKTDIILFTGFFLLLFGYLQGSMSLVSNGLNYVMLMVAVLLFFCYGVRKKSIAFEKAPMAAWFCILLPMLNRNYDLAAGDFEPLVRMGLFFLLLLLLIRDTDWAGTAWTVIRVYTVIHFALGLFFLLRQDLLTEYIIPRFHMSETTRGLLDFAMKSGYMTGICNHYTVMGLYMALGVVAFSGVLYREGRKKVTDYLWLAAFIVGLAITGKRGPLVFALLSLLIVWILLIGRKMSRTTVRRVVLIACIGVLLVIGAFVAIPQVQNLAGRFMESDSFSEITTGRPEFYWRHVYTMFTQDPLFGRGWRAFRELSVTEFNRRNRTDGHNIYLQLLGETGIFGFVLVMGAVIATLVATYRAIRYIMKHRLMEEKKAAVFGISLAWQVFFLLYGLTENALYDGACFYPYMVSAAAGWAAYVRVRHHKARQKKDGPGPAVPPDAGGPMGQDPQGYGNPA
ncbi:MAG: O-antigen ligase family protein [Lachnospiraceae bacterium]|nr:O-antigen ligase family protein [Lachnospiraceae bacterium]